MTPMDPVPKGAVTTLRKQKTLLRNPYRSRLGGVCAGLSDYTGLPLPAVRLLFLFSLLFGGMGFWLYMILWITVPARQPLPFPTVSPCVRWHYYRMSRTLARIHRTQDANLADEAQDLFERAKLLAPLLDLSAPDAEDTERQALLRKQLPQLFEQLARLPQGAFDGREQRTTRRLAQELTALSERIDEALNQQLSEAVSGFILEDAASPSRIRYQQRLMPLKQRLASAAPDDALALLEAIDEKLRILMDPTRKDFLQHRGSALPEVERIALDYLPQTLNAYLQALEGHECFDRHQVNPELDHHLRDQLTLLDRTLGECLKSLYREDARSLRIQGRFLHEKFEGAAQTSDASRFRNPLS